MSALNAFFSDTLTIQRAGDRGLVTLKASVDSQRILVEDLGISIRNGDILHHHLPNRTDELFVKRSSYCNGIPGVMPPYYVLTYRRGERRFCVDPEGKCWAI